MQLHAGSAVSAETIPVILNGSAGKGVSDPEEIHRQLAQAGLDARFLTGNDIGELASRAIAGKPPVVVAGGGDGTLSRVADVLRGTQTALGILPLGTLNHFARDLGIPLALEDAVRTIARGRRVAVDMGEVNGRGFLNNSSLGLYPDIVRERRRQQRRLGRSKRSAMIWATLAALDRAPLLSLSLELDERVQACRAPFVFVGNNDYVMEGFEIGTRERLDGGRLCIYTTQRSSRGGLIALALRALCGRLRQADDFIELKAKTLRVETPHKRLIVATDGEVAIMDTPLDYRILPRCLKVIVP
jgi:diacylglycerol kinase family enzyme